LKLKVHPSRDGKTILSVNSLDTYGKLKLFLLVGIRALCFEPELPLKSRLHIVDEFNGQYGCGLSTDQGRFNGADKIDEEEDEEEQEEIVSENPK
jgi:hypothetical protein